MARNAHIVLCLVTGVIVTLAAPVFARPLSKCRLGNHYEYYSIADETISENARKEIRLRVLIDAIDDVDIAFRGRLIKRRYLSDVFETEVPTILEVYGSVTVLKGNMPDAAVDGKAFLIREKVCDGGCWLNALPEVTDGHDEPERVVLAMKNTLAPSTEAQDRVTGHVIYSGRIDALSGPCDPRQINATSAAMLLTSPAEMERLRRAYPPRTPEDKRRDADFINRRVIGVK